MSQRLRMARILAGYKTASEAILEHGWMSSAYRAHENGQNKFGPATAEKYAIAYNTTTAWLVLGLKGQNMRPDVKSSSKHIPSKRSHIWTVEKIYALAVMFRDDEQNIDLLRELINYAQTYEKMVVNDHVNSIS